MDTPEYSQFIRVPSTTYLPIDYKFIDTRAPLTVQKHARELTSARGRILYEYWDAWNDKVIGWAAPIFAVDQAFWHHRRGGLVAHGAGLSPQRLRVLQDARAMLELRFPRMLVSAAKAISQAAQHQDRSVERSVERSVIEERVVNYVKHEWTNYELELENAYRKISATNIGIAEFDHLDEYYQRKQTEEMRVLEAIKPRMREVLQSWLPEDMKAIDLANFWHRHGLFDSPSGNGQCKEKDVVFSSITLQSYAGRETIANVVGRVYSWL